MENDDFINLDEMDEALSAAYKIWGVCRVVIEVPIEQHRQVTNGFWDADVLVTLSDGKQGYGMAASCQPSVDSCDDERPSISDGLCSICG